MVYLTKIESEFTKYDENNLWRDVYQDVREADDIFNLTCNYGRQPINLKYNRYRDILPYDHTRVKLKSTNETDYINANHVMCDLADRKYILAQGPLRNTCEHFWQMVWEQNTKGVVMLNKLYEKGTLKCEMYYPNVDEENTDLTLEFGKFRLNYMSEKPYQDFTIRTIECENLEQKEKRIVYHCHFTSWPDFGEPEYTSTFLKFLNECNNLDLFNNSVSGPAVVHCSAGVGRSGTFVLVDSMLQLYKTYGNSIPIDTLDLLKQFRSHRMGLVQTHQQLKFAFMAIIDGIRDLRETSTTSINGLSSEQANSNETDSENDDDSDSDDFYENEADDDTKTKRLKRPDTAKHGKRQDLSEKSKQHIKNLRQQQLKNKNVLEQNNNIVKKETSSDTNEQVDSSDIDDEDEESPFAANRDVQTVKVNQPRKPIEPLVLTKCDESKIEFKFSNDVISKKIEMKKMKRSLELDDKEMSKHLGANEETDKSLESPKKLSDKEQRISNLVNSMKEKQKKHERKSKIMSEIRPLIYGGTMLIGGILIHQIYKNFFSK